MIEMGTLSYEVKVKGEYGGLWWDRVSASLGEVIAAFDSPVFSVLARDLGSPSRFGLRRTRLAIHIQRRFSNPIRMCSKPSTPS